MPRGGVGFEFEGKEEFLEDEEGSHHYDERQDWMKKPDGFDFAAVEGGPFEDEPIEQAGDEAGGDADMKLVNMSVGEVSTG